MVMMPFMIDWFVGRRLGHHARHDFGRLHDLAFIIFSIGRGSPGVLDG